MAEDLAFARKASGLVRGLSMTDAFAVGLMNQGITPSIWTMITWGLGTYLTGNLFWACVISLVLVGFGFPMVWGILSGSMPRSGGEYVYNSRIIHPIVAIAESFGNAFVMIFWVYVLAPWVADPGLVILAEYQGWTWLYDAANETFFGGLQYEWGVFLVATVINILAFLTMVFGVKIFALIQKFVMIFALGGAVVITGALTFTSKAAFAENWDAFAAEYDSLKYADVVPAVAAAIGEAVPTSSTLYGTLGVMVAGSWLFAYSYCITFIAGEVKRPDKSIILGNLFAILAPAFFMLWLAIVLYNTVGFQFLTATAFVDETLGGELAGYTFPWSPHFVGLAAVINQNPIVLFLMSLSFVLFALWWVALSYLAFPRILFAWGMDRMGPRWFTDLHPRWTTPVKTLLLCFVLGEIGIALYSVWQEQMSGLSVTGLEIVSVFGVTAIAATIFPFIRKVKNIWAASPYKNWRLLGIPAVTIGGIVNLIYLAILFYFFIVMPDLEGLAIGSLIFYLVIWGVGIAWYLFWKARNKQVGIDVDMAYGELPPE